MFTCNSSTWPAGGAITHLVGLKQLLISTYPLYCTCYSHFYKAVVRADITIASIPPSLIIEITARTQSGDMEDMEREKGGTLQRMSITISFFDVL